MRRRHPLWQLFLARLREFYREPSVIFWTYGFPLFLAIGLGVAFAGGLPLAPAVDTHLPPEVDIQRTAEAAEAAELQRRLEADGFAARLVGAEAARQRLRTARAAVVVVPAPEGYTYIYDPTRPDSTAARFRLDDAVQRWKAGARAWPVSDQPVHEAGDRYIDYLIPGLMGLNLMGGGLWGVGYVIVDMRVRKVLKLLLALPMRKSDFLLSVLASRLVLLVPEMLLLALAGWLLFSVPVRGSLAALTVVIFVGGVTFAGLGLVLACRTEKTETVTGLINLLVLPMWMLSGTFFPPTRFPAFLQPVVEALPLTHLNVALREVVLEGATLAHVAGRLAILAAWAAASFFLALLWFRWR
jgi:ABC-type multidrug transport system permease subunit